MRTIELLVEWLVVAPLAFMLAVLAFGPAALDLRDWWRRRK